MSVLVIAVVLFTLWMVVRGDDEVRRSEEYWQFVSEVENHPTMPEETKRQIIREASEMRDNGLPFYIGGKL